MNRRPFLPPRPHVPLKVITGVPETLFKFPFRICLWSEFRERHPHRIGLRPVPLLSELGWGRHVPVKGGVRVGAGGGRGSVMWGGVG